MERTARDFDDWWDYGDPAGTAAKFRTRLESATEDLYYRLELLTQLARTQGLQRRFAEAHAILDDVEAQLTADMPVARVRFHLERGRTLNSSGDKQAASAHFLAAWEEAQAAKADFFAVDAAHMMAIVADSADQIHWNEAAMAYAEASEMPRARNWLGSLYNNLGWTYHDLADFERAHELFQKALSFNVEKGREDRIRIAKWCVARCLRSMRRYDEALALQRELEPADETGYVAEEIAELLLIAGEDEAARPYFARAHALLSQDDWLKAEEAERLARLERLGQTSS